MVTVIDRKRLRARLEAARVFEQRELSSWLKLVAMLSVVAAALVGVVLLPPWASLVLVPIAAIAATTAAMLGHEGCHRSFSACSRRNALLTHLTFPLLSGLSAMYWRHKHNGLHHGHPNVLGGDPDIDIWPMASCRADHQAAGPLRRWFQRHLQGVAFWPLTTMMPTIMRIPSIRFVLADLRKRGLTRTNVADGLCLLGHYTLWLVIPSLVWGPLAAFALYLTLWGIVGVLLALIFAPAHIGLPIVATQYRDWLHQLETTRNLRMPAWLRWFFIGLDYQVEHHLFPTIPHQNMSRARDIVRAWCAELGLPHQEVGYGEALVSVTSFIRHAWAYDPGSRETVRARTVSAHARHVRELSASGM